MDKKLYELDDRTLFTFKTFLYQKAEDGLECCTARKLGSIGTAGKIIYLHDRADPEQFSFYAKVQPVILFACDVSLAFVSRDAKLEVEIEPELGPQGCIDSGNQGESDG